jgi:putative inorganic carbon (hco3(-)) transporter
MLGLSLGFLIPWVVYFCVFAAALAALFWRPSVGIFVLIPLLPNQTLRYKLHELPAGAQTIDLLLLCIALGILFRGRRLFPDAPIRAPILAIWIVTFVSLWAGSLMHDMPLPFPGDPRWSEWKNYCRILLVPFLVIGAIRTRRQMVLAVLCMMAGLLVVERGFILSNRGRSFSTFSYGLRDTGTMPIAGENGLAAFLAQTGLFLAGFAVSQPSLRNAAVTALALGSAGCLMLTFSRGGYMGFLAGFFALTLLKRQVLLTSVLATVLIAAVAGTTLVPGAVLERISMTRSEEGELDSSSAKRLIMWQFALDMFWSNPVLGAGFDTYRYRVEYDSLRDTHSYYLKVISETGLAGTLVFLWLLTSAWYSAWRLYRDADKDEDPVLMSIGLGTFACVFCVALVNIFGDRWTYLEITGYTCVMFGMVARGRQLLDGDETEDPEEESADSEDAEPELSDASA